MKEEILKKINKAKECHVWCVSGWSRCWTLF
jgi:hypothetical protein